MHPTPPPLQPETRHRHSPARTLAVCVLFGAALLGAGMSAPAEPSTTEPPPAAVEAGEEGLRECVILFKTGREITGFLIESLDDAVVLRLEGIDTTYRRKMIDSIKFLPPVSERYREIRSNIDDTDIETRLILVEWLRARQSYTLALDELGSILEIEPGNAHARTLHNWLKAHLELAAKTAESTNTDEPADPSTTSTDPDAPRRRPAKGPPVPTLSPEQINLMRVYEIDLRNPPKMVIPDDTLRTLMTRHPDRFPANEDEREAIFELPEHEKLRLLFTYRARDLYPEVQVLGDPAMMQTFKKAIHARNGWLINACASSRCHGGSDSGSFRLINDRPNTDETAYTNFTIIDQYRLNDGTPLIDYEHPARSVLLQMATRRINALRPHPEVPLDRPGSRYRPIFRTTRDRKYQQAVDWIGSIYQPRIQYELGYPPVPVADPPTPEPEPEPQGVDPTKP